MAKRFFFVCAGILCLFATYHLGAMRSSAQAQSRGSIKFVDASAQAYVVIVSDNDDIYVVDPTKLPNVAKGTGWWRFNLNAVK